jgi:hypothetical protein
VIDFEFSAAALGRRIVWGALEQDAVRLHGAIVAAFEIHGFDGARRDVFPHSRRLAEAFSPDCHAAVAEAIASHLHGGWLRMDEGPERLLG